MILNPAKRELLAAELLEAEGLSPVSRSLTRDALRRLCRNKAAVASIIVLTTASAGWPTYVPPASSTPLRVAAAILAISSMLSSSESCSGGSG